MDETQEMDSMQNIEQACRLGHVSEVDGILNNALSIDKAADFISAISCSIEYQNLNLFKHLMSKTSFQDVLKDHAVQFKQLMMRHDSLHFIQLLDEQLSQSGKSTTLSVESLATTNLYHYYQTLLANHTLDYHLNLISDELAKRYQKNPAKYLEHTLPLHWEDFTNINVEAAASKDILSAYHEHSIHTAWRYLLTTHPWRAPSANIYLQQSRQDSLWFIVLIWLAATDEQLIKEDSNRQVELFIQTLAGLNGDKNIRQELLQVLIFHPLVKTPNNPKFIEAEENFIKQKWSELFNKYTIEQYLQMKYHFERCQQQPSVQLSIDYMQKFNLTEMQFQEFELMMQSQWGERVPDNATLVLNSQKRLLGEGLLCLRWQKTFQELIIIYGASLQAKQHTQHLQFFQNEINEKEKSCTTLQCL